MGIDQIGGRLRQIVALIIIGRQLDLVAQLLQVAQHQALPQLHHLIAGVVVVILALHVETGGFQQARHGIADDSAARMPDGDWPAGVGADELDLGFLAGAHVEGKQGLALGDDGIDLPPEEVLGNEAIDEAGRRHPNLTGEVRLSHFADD